MLKKLKKCLFISMFTFAAVQAHSFEYSPPNNGSGAIPNGYDEITFKVSDGRWTKNVTFPTNPRNNDIVIIESNAQYDTYIDGNKTDLPYSKLLLKTGQYYKFRYDAQQKEWKSQVSTQTPVNESARTTVKIGNNNVVRLDVKDGSWTQEIILPNNVSYDKFAYVHSKAAYPSKIQASGKTYNLVKGQSYLFVFDENKKWKIAKEF